MQVEQDRYIGPGLAAGTDHADERLPPLRRVKMEQSPDEPVAGVRPVGDEQRGGARRIAHENRGLFVGNSRPFDRRGFIAAGAAGLLASCGWDGGPGLRPAMKAAGGFNDRVSALLFSPSRLARQYDVSKRSSSFPNYFISGMMPKLDEPAAWNLEVGGMVRTPLMLSVDEIREMGRLTYTVKHHCVEGWSAIATWTGTPLRAVAERAGVLPGAAFVRFDSFDAGYYNGWDLPSAMHPETILAWGFNDRELMGDHGAPLRLYAPHKLGYKLTKYLTRITFMAERPGGYWEDQGYPWFGGL
jgi:DMSO/TMAO reductase YedYZ molybdopterin-dependent catalytic subunit